MKVNVWLGHGDESVIREAFECCRLVANACREFSSEHDISLDDIEIHKAVEVTSDIFTLKIRRSLANLFGHPLFSRVWCRQEIKLAQDALLVWGEQYLPWAEVGLTSSWMFRTRFDGDEASRKLFEEIFVANVNTIFESNTGSYSLLRTLSDFRDFQSTDPRDKVYGLISLVRSEAGGISMVPDYEKSAARVFTDTALHTITSTKHLQVFSHVQHHANYDGDDEYRSWAPHWDLPSAVFPIGHSDMTPEPGACSGREARIVVTKSPGGEQLCLTGILYAKVTTCDDVMYIPIVPSLRSDGLQKYHQIVEVYEEIDWNDPMSDITLPVLARTLTAGARTIHYPLIMLDDESRCAYYEAFRHYVEWYRTPTADFDNLRDDAIQYHGVLRTCIRNRRFFWTSGKDYGIGPACMREGDIVVVLYGGATPYVLRPKGDKYLMLGEAYVDSIMNGELIKEVEEGKRQEQEFCLI